MRSDSECLGQKMAKIQDCEGASRPGTKQAWRGSLQSSPEFGCGACILVIFCPSHSHRGAWSCFLLLSRLPSSPMLLSAYFRQHLPQENIDFKQSDQPPRRPPPSPGTPDKSPPWKSPSCPKSSGCWSPQPALRRLRSRPSCRSTGRSPDG